MFSGELTCGSQGLLKKGDISPPVEGIAVRERRWSGGEEGGGEMLDIKSPKIPKEDVEPKSRKENRSLQNMQWQIVA